MSAWTSCPGSRRTRRLATSSLVRAVRARCVGRFPGTVKRGGARVIFFNQAEDETVLVVMMYAKNDRENAIAGEIKRAM